MLSTRSYCKTLIRSDYRRFWPVPAVYAAFWFLVMTACLSDVSPHARVVESSGNAMTTLQVTPLMMANRDIMDMMKSSAVISVFLGLMLAMSLFSYLMQSRSIGLMHSLPVTRRQQFLAHTLSGVSMFTAGNLVAMLAGLCMELGRFGAADIKTLLLWFAVCELECLFFFAFGILCCMATGWLLAVPVIYAGLNFLYLAVETLVRLMRTCYWGISDSFGIPSVLAKWFTPSIKFFNLTEVKYDEVYDYAWCILSPNAVSVLIVYTVVAAAMLAGAYGLYRLRHSETAGDPIVFAWLRPIVRVVIGVVGGVGFGMLIAAIFGVSVQEFWEMVPYEIGATVVVTLGLEMILKKSYRVFRRRTLRSLGTVLAVLVLLLTGIRLDVFGVQRYVPPVDAVDRVELYTGGSVSVTLRQPQSIEMVTALHRTLLPPVEIVYGEGRDLRVCSIFYNVGEQQVSREYEYYTDNTAVVAAMDAVLHSDEARGQRIFRENAWKGHGAVGTEFIGGYYENYGADDFQRLDADAAARLYEALVYDRTYNSPSIRYSLNHEMDECINIMLETRNGEYELIELTPECSATLDALTELGYIEKPEEAFYSYYEHK